MPWSVQTPPNPQPLQWTYGFNAAGQSVAYYPGLLVSQIGGVAGQVALTNAAQSFTAPQDFAAGITVENGSTVSGGLNTDNLTASGNVSTKTLAVSGPTTISGPAGTYREIDFDTGTLKRWAIFVGTLPETGNNAGSSFNIQRFDDNGNLLDGPIFIHRDTGLVEINDGLQINQVGLTVSGGSTFNGNLQVQNPAGTNRGLFFATSGGGTRWIVYEDGSAESGGNAGSNFNIGNYTDAGAFVANQVTINRATGIVGFSQTPTAPTQPISDNSTNLATSAFVWSRGMQSRGQFQINASTTLSDANAGGTILVGTAGITITFPNTGGSLNRTFILSNTSGGQVTLAFPGGSDGSTVMNQGQKVIFAGDGGGYWRLISATANYLFNTTNGYEMSPSGVLRQWGLTGNVPASGNSVITFPTAFPNNGLNVTITPTAGGGGGSNEPYVGALSKTSFTLYNPTTTAMAFYWQAIGN